MPPIPEAIEWVRDIPKGSPTPTYKPSTLAISTMATLARLRASIGGVSNIGVPPTPMPTLAWIGMVGLLADLLDEGHGASDVPGGRLVRLGVDHRPEDVGAGLLDHLQLLMREHARQPLAVVLDLAVHAEDELARHAHFDAEVGRLLEVLHRLQRGQEVGVAGRGRGVEVDAVGADLVEALAHEDHVFHAQLGGLHLLFTSLVDLHHAQQIGGVGEGPVRRVVEAHVRHGAVEHREHGGRHHTLDGHLVQRDHGLGRLEGVVDPAQLHGVEREHALEDFDRVFAAYRQV